MLRQALGLFGLRVGLFLFLGLALGGFVRRLAGLAHIALLVEFLGATARVFRWNLVAATHHFACGVFPANNLALRMNNRRTQCDQHKSHCSVGDSSTNSSHDLPFVILTAVYAMIATMMPAWEHGSLGEL